MLQDSGLNFTNATVDGPGIEVADNPFFNATDFNNLVTAIIDGTTGNITFISFDTVDVKQIMRETIEELLDIKIDLKVKQILDTPMGKWPENLGNVVFMENEFFFDYLREDMVAKLERANIRVSDNITESITGGTIFRSAIENTVNEQVITPIIEGFDTLNLKENALTMNAVVNDKPTVYASFRKFDDNLIDISNRMMRELGDSSKYTITSPMLIGFEILGYLSLFIDNLIYAILIVLAILSYILISSLMVFNIDEKTYEFGMLRALGFKR